MWEARELEISVPARPAVLVDAGVLQALVQEQVLRHTEYLMLVNGPGYHREFRQHGAVQMQGKLARQIAATQTIFTVPESPGDCRKHTLGFVLKDGREALTRYVNLPATIKIDVPRREVPDRP